MTDDSHDIVAELDRRRTTACDGGYTTGSIGSTQEHIRNSIKDLGRLIAAKRVGRGVRAAALEVGVSPATLSRVENGHMPDLGTFAKICQWLDRDPREFLGMEVRDEATRDEIVALRKLTDGAWVWKQITDTRDAALEEAVRTCERQRELLVRDDIYGRGYGDGMAHCASAIRALKEARR